MRMIKPLFILAALINSSLVSAAVTIKINGQLFEYAQPVRMEQVLTPVANTQNWYWPASQLFETDAPELAAKHDSVVKDINRLGTSALGGVDSAQLKGLLQQIQYWHMAKRIHIDISFDMARLNPAKNRQFNTGNYLLNLSTRPSSVAVFGMVKQPLSVPNSGRETVNDILDSVALADGADNDYVYVITPGGDIEKRGIAYWNRSSKPLMPGSQIYVPIFESVLSPAIAKLNQNIAELAVNRVLSW